MIEPQNEAADGATPAADVSAGAAVLENPHAERAAPMERQTDAVLVEGAPLERAAEESPEPAAELEPVDPVTEENPHDVATAPSESQAGSVLAVDEGSSSAPSSAPVEAPPATVAAPPPAVRVLPRRPRLRASFHYDHEDRIVVELTLMDERRNLIHRLPLMPEPGGVVSRIFEHLVAMVAQAASRAGVFGGSKDPP